ncbi:MAG: LpxI family protein [Acidobacteriota bacterium]
MGRRLGIIALGGAYPFYVLDKALKKRIRPLLVAVRGIADPKLEAKASEFQWFDLNEIFSVAPFLKKTGVRNVLFAGKIDPAWGYNKRSFSKEAGDFFRKLKDQRPSAIIGEVINLFEQQGFTVEDPRLFLEDFFCSPGLFTREDLTFREQEDLEFGLPLARKIADLDIGQTVVIKEKMVVAVEGIEGTDEVIKRGGGLAGEGIMIIKAGRSKQDFRVDMPAVGLSTVQSLVESGARSLCFEAVKVPFFQKEEAVALANSRGITIKAVVVND